MEVHLELNHNPNDNINASARVSMGQGVRRGFAGTATCTMSQERGGACFTHSCCGGVGGDALSERAAEASGVSNSCDHLS
jgi:hypothetical protein